ncbi:hypothetical protein M0R04_12140 [Candidatus Dojkabacteria bacterium]|jgi:hypothetical protein|nr:hypothetical protein [Candidatus Dojkabacteria bacterium]
MLSKTQKELIDVLLNEKQESITKDEDNMKELENKIWQEKEEMIKWQSFFNNI